MPEDAGKGVFHFQSEVTLRLTTGVSIIAYAQDGALRVIAKAAFWSR